MGDTTEPHPYQKINQTQRSFPRRPTRGATSGTVSVDTEIGRLQKIVMWEDEARSTL
jgi:hypothetical protein